MKVYLRGRSHRRISRVALAQAGAEVSLAARGGHLKPCRPMA